MADETNKNHRHFILEGFTETERYRSLQGGKRSVIPGRNRPRHGRALLAQLEALSGEAARARDLQEAAGFEDGFGLQVEFESFPDVELAFESLARERSGIELLNVRHDDVLTYATVFVPDGKLPLFERLIRAYLEERRDKAGNLRDNQRLVDAIREIRAATVSALWTDDRDVFPVAKDETFWWEVWLPVRKDRSAIKDAFRSRALAQDIRVATGELEFPERTVVLAYASLEQMQRSMVTLNNIAELRRAKETAAFFDALRPEEQAAWLDELLARTQFPHPGENVPHVCLLDTGVNRGHPLLAPALDVVDLHTVEPGWGTDDGHGHGTQMAGLALGGNLTDLLDGDGPVEIEHRLESVKLLPHDGANSDDPHHHGYLTAEAVARPEITAPSRQRVFGMAVTAQDTRDRGRPSAWSAAVDSLAADADGYGANPRLLVLSAGNSDPNAWNDYPDNFATDSVHDPAQAWNALTVGAYTDLAHITDPDTDDYTPVAPAGGLSPFTTTSLTWGKLHWPLKPDVLFEGGNAARDGLGVVETPSLSLLTTHYLPTERLFTTTNATSAATALATRMAAQVMAAYPELWPETVRGLIVHSAEWTDRIREQFLPTTGTPSKTDYLQLLRRCGFGVPNLERALWSVSNSLTMLVEEQLHPFRREGRKEPTLRDMHLHRLPWPQDALEDLGDTLVEMRVTLSYFIEPNPSARGAGSRYRYESHGLRFDVMRPAESVDEFRRRINRAARDEEEGTRVTESDLRWSIGKTNRHRGSLHSDIWRGPAVDLASRGALAVYPAMGWWKTRHGLERYDSAARYALIVSIKAPAVDVDLYTEVANRIAVPVPVET